MGKQRQAFNINGKEFELVATGKGLGKSIPTQVAILKQSGTNQFAVIPVTELSQMFNSGTNMYQILKNRLQLYKQRFIGRTDVYAHRYYNKKMAKYAYSPVVPFQNGKPMLNQWIPLTDNVIRKHLTGEEFLGFYPMFPDDTTKYLVLDIDGHHEGDKWQEITNSIQRICKKYGISLLTELSQSGHGCHIWIFFNERITAENARRLGDAILKATMAINPNLPFSAFDRMFPSQDFIDKRKIGNLIAGPLQGERRKYDNSIFVDHSFKPLPDQWRALAEVSLLDSDKIKALISDLSGENNFRLFDDKQPQTDLLTEPLKINQPITVIRSNSLFFKKSELTSRQINQLKWLASFKNPMFYEKQRNRMPIFNIPRIISLFDETEQFLALPRGLEEELMGLIPHITWTDKTITGKKIHATFNGTLRPEQQSALKALTDHHIGVLSARTGFGKTVIAAKLIANIGVSTLILVHDKGLAKQWIERLNHFLNIADKPFVTELTPTGRKRHKNVIGRYFGTSHNRSGIIDVATIQSFKNNAASKKILDQYGLIISDEVHHDAAFTFEQVIKELSCKYLYGLSATPYRRDGQDPIISMRFGPIRYQTTPIDEKTLNQVKRIVIPRFTNLGITNLEIANNDINNNYEAIVNDNSRNQSIIQDITDNLSQGRHVLVLTRRVEHVHRLASMLNEQQHTFLLYGEQNDKENAKVISEVNKLSEPYAIIATGKYAGEGLDIASIDTLILAMPHSWKGNSVQYLGRTQRNLAEKSEIRVYDYIDMFVPMLAKMYRKRQKAYRNLYYTISNDERSEQSGIKFFDGHYQQSILNALENAHQLNIITNKLGPFLMTKVIAEAPQDTKINFLTNESDPIKQQSGKKNIRYTLYDRNLPNCLIINNQQMWLSSDLGFSRNSGITIRIDQPELVKQFMKMLTNTIERLENS